MARALIVGYGNPLRGDDGVGWQVARRLQDLLPPGVATVRTCIQLAPELAADVSQFDIAVFIDARAGEPAGVVTWERVLPPSPVKMSFSHHFTPTTLLAWARRLFGRAPRALLVSVTGTEFAYREGLSPAVAAAVPRAVALVSKMLNATPTPLPAPTGVAGYRTTLHRRKGAIHRAR